MNITTSSPAKNPVPRTLCQVSECLRRVEGDAHFCKRCWALLPEGAAWVLRRALKDLRNPDLASVRRSEIDALAQAEKRLACEFRPPPSPEELAEADELTRQHHAFGTFNELLDAPGGYWPKFDLSHMGGMDPKTRQGVERLCDLYDRGQHARLDPRRATRLGFCGL